MLLVFKRITTLILLAGLPLGGRTPYITSKNRLCTPKLNIKDVPRTSENSLVRPKMDIETSCRQKKTRPHLPDYVIYVPPSYWKLIYFVYWPREDVPLDWFWEFYWQSVSRVGFRRKGNYKSVSSNRCEILHRHILTTALEPIPARRTSSPWAIKRNGQQPYHYPFCLTCRPDTLHACEITFINSTRLRRN